MDAFSAHSIKPVRLTDDQHFELTILWTKWDWEGTSQGDKQQSLIETIVWAFVLVNSFRLLFTLPGSQPTWELFIRKVNIEGNMLLPIEWGGK